MTTAGCSRVSCGTPADGSRKGVISFKRAAYINACFVGAERLSHWQRVYRPRGKMRDVQAPQWRRDSTRPNAHSERCPACAAIERIGQVAVLAAARA
ncbi:MAG: hypothetical protein SFX73_34900 [Kofleriaceae bacterium]|nr:hypothetical protein [Kofleriaceae bacterium]